MANGNKNLFLLFGSLIALIFGLVSAFVPALAYATICTYRELWPEPSVPFVRYSP